MSEQNTAFNPAVPVGERTDALAQLQKAYLPSASDLIPADQVQSVVASVCMGYEEAEFAKAMSPAMVDFPSRNAVEGNRGMQSVRLDDMYLQVNGDYWERPGLVNFDAMQRMVDQTPILSAIVLTRIRQVQRFCRVAEKGIDAPGFELRLADKAMEMNPDRLNIQRALTGFFQNCGFENKPRRRKALRRDAFPQFMAKLIRDSLTYDAAAIECEWKQNAALGIDGIYAVDGSTIRLVTEQGYRGDDAIQALQVVEGKICTAYTFQDLIYEPRNPRTSVYASGYGLSEPELLVKTVTGFLNAMTYNIKGFDSNAIPKGMLHLTGNYSDTDIAAFKRYWNAMVRGVDNAFALPVMVSKDQESKAGFEKFGIEFDEMAFAKWMTFLTSIACAIYGMSPSEINFDSFSGGSTSPLGGSDTSEKLAASKDSGLRPILGHFEQVFSDYIVSEFDPSFVFRWTGLDPEDAEKKHELLKLTATVNEVRAMENRAPMPGPLGDAPLNPSLIGPWMQLNGQGGQPGMAPEGVDGPQPDQDFGEGTDAEGKDFGEGPMGAGGDGLPDDAGAGPDFGEQVKGHEDFGKAFGMPEFSLLPTEGGK